MIRTPSQNNTKKIQQQLPGISSNVTVASTDAPKQRISDFPANKRCSNADGGGGKKTTDSSNVTPRKSILAKRVSMAQGRKSVSFMTENERKTDIPERLNKVGNKEDRETDEKMKRLHQIHPNQHTNSILFHPVNLFRSTSTFTATSSVSNQKMEIITRVNENIWMARVVGKEIQLLKFEDGVFILKDSMDSKESLKCTPLALQFIHDQLKRDIFFVMGTENRMILFEFIDGVLECFHNEAYSQKKSSKTISNPVISFEPFSATLVFSNNTVTLTFVNFGGKDNVKTTTFTCDYRNKLNILLKKTKVPEELELLMQSRMTRDNGEKVVKLEKLIFNTKTMSKSELEPCRDVKTLGHLVSVLPPFVGYYIIGKDLISYQNEFIAQSCNRIQNFLYKSFGLLSPSKLLFLTKDGDMYMCHLVIEEKDSHLVHSIHLQRLEMMEKVKNFAILDEFQLLINKTDNSWQYFKMRHVRPTSKYELKPIERADEQEELTSPPLFFNGNVPVAQPKTQMLQEGDLLNGRWEIMSMLGRGGYGQVFNARDKSNNAIVAVKVQKTFCTKAINNELHFLKLIKNQNVSGFPRLIYTCEWFQKWTCIVMSSEGQSLKCMLEKSNHKFNAHNCKWIFSRLTQLVGKMSKLGYVHQDLHSGNVLLKKENRQLQLCLIDFGRTQKIGEAPTTTCEDADQCCDIVESCGGFYASTEQKWLDDSRKIIEDSRMKGSDPLPRIGKMVQDLGIGQPQFVYKDGDGFTLL